MFSSNNNEAKYEALIASLKASKELGVQHLKVYSDSQLIVSHVLNEYEAREKSLKKYLQKVKDLIPIFTTLAFNKFLKRRMLGPISVQTCGARLA